MVQGDSARISWSSTTPNLERLLLRPNKCEKMEVMDDQIARRFCKIGYRSEFGLAKEGPKTINLILINYHRVTGTLHWLLKKNLEIYGCSGIYSEGGAMVNAGRDKSRHTLCKLSSTRQSQWKDGCCGFSWLVESNSCDLYFLWLPKCPKLVHSNNCAQWVEYSTWATFQSMVGIVVTFSKIVPGYYPTTVRRF
ncbi:hypothetical protein WN48_04397 [Eufriesea mexicana]|nr:hypothetical protein WN48_04397 [Eufriesea mexicana]